jgi:hypothetical protein
MGRRPALPALNRRHAPRDLVIGGGWTEIAALAAAFVIAVAATPAGISGAVLLLPFQVSVLGTPSPAVTPTNLLYNVIATPRGAVPVLAARADWRASGPSADLRDAARCHRRIGRPRRTAARPARVRRGGRCRPGSAGAVAGADPACSTGQSPSAGRKAQALRSSSATGRCGPRQGRHRPHRRRAATVDPGNKRSGAVDRARNSRDARGRGCHRSGSWRRDPCRSGGYRGHQRDYQSQRPRRGYRGIPARRPEHLGRRPSRPTPGEVRPWDKPARRASAVAQPGQRAYAGSSTC